eukprot:363637-Chlamydomonas_euryale.AAC.15
MATKLPKWAQPAHAYAARFKAPAIQLRLHASSSPHAHIRDSHACSSNCHSVCWLCGRGWPGCASAASACMIMCLHALPALSPDCTCASAPACWSITPIIHCIAQWKACNSCQQNSVSD